MDPIKLKEDGCLQVQRGRVLETPLLFLGYKLILAADARLRTYFKLMKRYPVLVGLNPFLKTFMEHYDECPASGCIHEDVERVILSRTVEMVGFPGPPSMQIYVSLDGRKDQAPCEIKAFWLSNLLDLPLTLGPLKHVVFGDKVDTFEFETAYTLFEFIDAIAWQLSFHNVPRACRIEI